MINPSVTSLLEKVENRYVLVNVTAKRARMLNEGAQPLSLASSDKNVTKAIKEINDGKVRYHKTNSLRSANM